METKTKQANGMLLDANPESFDDILADLDKPLQVCFVCTGNTCRSPMAAAVANNLYGDRVKAVSCGLYPSVGSPISPNAAAALQKAGIPSVKGNDYLQHTAQAASLELLSPCDRIYGMSDRHTMLLITEFPELASKIFSMPCEVGDPWGGDREKYDRCLALITDCVKELFSIE